MGLRDKLRRLERAVEGETVTLRCRECGEEMTVAEDTDIHLICWDWEQGVRDRGGEPEVYRPRPPDVFVITGHRCGWDSLEVKATGKPWPLSDVGGGVIGLTIR